MTGLKLIVLVWIVCSLSLVNFAYASMPVAYFNDDFTSFADFSARWTNSTHVSVGWPLASILNFSNGQVESRTSYFQGTVEMQVNASRVGDFFGFSDGSERLGFMSDTNNYYFVSQNATVSIDPIVVSPVDSAFHVFALVWFYEDTSLGPQQFVQPCVDGTCSTVWRIQSPTFPIAKKALPIVLMSNSTAEQLQVDWVTYSYNGVFVSPSTVVRSTVTTITEATTLSQTRTNSSLKFLTVTSVTTSYRAIIGGTITNVTTQFTTALVQVANLTQDDLLKALTTGFLFGAFVAYIAWKRTAKEKIPTPVKLFPLVLDILPLVILTVILLNLHSVMAAMSKYLDLLGFTILQAILALIFPIAYDLPKTIVKATVIMIDDIHQTLTSASHQTGTSQMIGVSVIVPAHNEERNISKCVSSILEAKYEPKEVIVVDDGSVDGTYDRLMEISRDHQITVVRKEASGNRATPCNFGTQFATQPIYVFMDGDTFMYRNALAKISAPFQNPNIVAVAGNVRIYNTSCLLAKMQAYEYMLSMEYGRRFQSIVQTLLIVPGGFGAARATYFRQIGGYDATLAEDMDATFKMHKTRGRIVFAKDAIVLTVAPETWKTWIRQRVRWSAGQIEALRKHKNILLKKFFRIPGLFGAPEMILSDVIVLYARFIWFFFLLVWKWYELPQVLALVISFYGALELLAAYISGVTTSLKRDVKYIPLLPLIILVYRPLHDFLRLISYSGELLHRSRPAW